MSPSMVRERQVGVPEWAPHHSPDYQYAPQLRALAKLGPLVTTITTEHKYILLRSGVHSSFSTSLHQFSMQERQQLGRGTKEEWARKSAEYMTNLFTMLAANPTKTGDMDMGVCVMHAMGITSIGRSNLFDLQRSKDAIASSFGEFYDKYGGNNPTHLEQFALAIANNAHDRGEHAGMIDWLHRYGMLRIFGPQTAKHMVLLLEAAYPMPEHTHPADMRIPLETPEEHLGVAKRLGLLPEVRRDVKQPSNWFDDDKDEDDPFDFLRQPGSFKFPEMPAIDEEPTAPLAA